MESTRLVQLIRYYEEDPRDPFNIYALALEYLKVDSAKSKELFDILLTEHVDYVPTYYHAAKLYLELNNRERAISIYETGISKATALKDMKALRELQSSYQELLFD